MNKIRKAVLLAGGSGSRLKNLTKTVNKHMIPVFDRPMLQWNLEKVVDAGIKDILIISGTHHMGSIINYFGSGHEFGCRITYRVQDEAGGIAEALKLTKGFIDDEKFITILGDNIFEDSLHEFIFKCESSPLSRLGLTTYEADDPERFGVLCDGVIVEKPANPKSNNIIAGVYMYRADEDFWNILDGLEYSERGELEVTDLNNHLMKGGATRVVQYLVHPLSGYWTDAGTIDSLQLANKLVQIKR